jgi:hypothetical protein
MKHLASIAGALLLAGGAVLAADNSNPFIGRWALTIPGGGAGWLGVTQEKGWYDAGILWGGGSVEPASSVVFDRDAIYVSRTRQVQRKDENGKVVRTQQITDLITGKVDGDQINLAFIHQNDNGEGITREEFSGKRIPAVPPAPDLSNIKFGDPIKLFNDTDLSGWKLTDENQVNGWSVKDGILRNDPVQEEGKPHKNYGNLRTEKEFEDFQLTIEARVPKNGNSGIYLRGIYECQVADTYGHSVDSHNMGAIYSRLTPTEAAEKPAGEWQTVQITLCDRHATVILNGKKIIDNQPLLGCTGGALWSDEFKPGPIYLQGDHAGIEYRNIVLRPILK